ncbi:MAG: hypothetical protein Q7S87_08750 [Agitococcus sp.]|nr:hypothetical protein [Agitococcus sp.]MDO9176986.1 hypothetical protein [Agitococcus sp.]
MAMSTYGVDVATRVGLKSMLPPGWTLLLHKDVKLPDTISWRLGDAWTKSLAEFCVRSSTAALVDWDKRQVLLRAESIAIDEREQRAELKQTATTPLPSFGQAKTAFVIDTASVTSVPKQATPINLQQQDRQRELAQIAATSTAQFSFVPVIRTNPTINMVERQKVIDAGRTAQLISTEEFQYTSAISVNRPSARFVAQAIANRYNLRLAWSADEYQLQGPVTLLATTQEADIALLQRAMGAFSPVVLQLNMPDKVLRATPRTGTMYPTMPSTLSLGLAPDSLTPAELRGKRQAGLYDLTRSTNNETSETVAGPVTPPAAFLLQIIKGGALEEALTQFARKNGYTFEWKVTGGFDAQRDKTYESASIAGILAQVLPSIGLSADIYTREKHVIVRAADNAPRH